MKERKQAAPDTHLQTGLTLSASQKRVSEYYEQTDGSYQHWSGGLEPYCLHFGYWDGEVQSHSRSLQRMNEILATTAGVRDGYRILDAGCGVGASSIWLARTFDVQVVGITLSRLQCEKASGYAKEAKLSHKVSFLTRDFANTGFCNESFDVVWGLESVCHAPDKKAFIREASRILKKEGVLVVADGFINKRNLSKLDRYLLEKWLSG